jgi:hypothetical protein
MREMMNQTTQMILGVGGAAVVLGLVFLWQVVVKKHVGAFSRPAKPKNGKQTPPPSEQPVMSGRVFPMLAPEARKVVFSALQDKTLTDADRLKLKALLLGQPGTAAGPSTGGVAVAEPPVDGARVEEDGKYRVMVFSEAGEFNIDFKRTNKPVGQTVQLEPSMPQRGGHYMAVEREGYLMPYDPRLEPVVSGSTPQDAFEAVAWYEEVNPVYANTHGMLEHINTFLIGLLGAGLIFVAITALGMLGKR